MAAFSSAEWELLEAISETYALPESEDFKDPGAFNRLVRSRVPPRGGRFANDHRDTCAYIERSKNANVVAYTANFVVKAAAPPPEERHAAAAPPHHHHHSTAPQKAQSIPPEMLFVDSGCCVDCTFNPLNPIHAYFVNLEPSYIAARRKRGVQGDCDDLKMLERRFAYGYNAKVLDCERHITEQLPAHLKHEGRLSTSLNAAAATTTTTMTGGGGDDSAAEGARRRDILGQLSAWWKPLEPMVGTFVALPVWPTVLVRLKPLTTPPSEPLERGEEDERPADDAPWCSDADTIPVVLAFIGNRLSVLEKVYVKSIERWFRLPTVEYIEVFGVALQDGKPAYEKQTNNGQYQPPADVSEEELAEAMRN